MLPTLYVEGVIEFAEKLEDRIDLEDARHALREPGRKGPIPREKTHREIYR
jgi:hypothetical protein